MKSLDKIFLSERYFEQAEGLRKARILRNAMLLTSLFSLTYVQTCIMIDYTAGLYIMSFNFLAFILLPFLLKTKIPFLYVANLYIAAGALAIFGVIHTSGGLMSPVMPWIAASPAIAMMVTNRNSAFVWLLICLLGSLFFTYAYYNGLTPEAGYNTEFGYQTYFYSISMMGLVAIVFVINNVFESAKRRALNEVEDKNKEITEINEELMMQKEEIEAQRDTIEEKNITLEKTYSEILEKNRIIEKKNEDITASINYARRIQEAMLPPIQDVCAALGNSFILFRPRDIVSGDFYWYGETKGRKIIAAMDCTGHGVPGALMSMIGFNLLNEIILNKGIVLPGRIFEEVDKGIIKALKQDTTSNRDGMDGTICCIFEEDGEQIVEFAGAKNPLVMVKKW